MGTISVSLPSDGTTIDAADVNTPFNTIVNEINGNIDNANIKTAAAIAGSKLAADSIDVTAKASSWDGWVHVTDSWSYASSTTVTVPTDATTKYSVGDKIKFDNSSTKYFYVTAVSSTVLTLSGGTDYTVANSAISNVYYSKASTPLSFPQWFSYTPTWTNLTIGNGSQTNKFKMDGTKVTVTNEVTLGSTSSVGSGVTFTWPVTAASYATSKTSVGVGRLDDTGTAGYFAIVEMTSTTVGTVLAIGVGGTYANAVGLTSSIPHTWATTDIVALTSQYRV